MNLLAKKTRTDQKFIPIHLASLRVDSVLDFDLYLSVDHQPVLYRAADLPFTEKTRAKLIDNKVEFLYVTSENRDVYQRYIEANLPKILSDPEIPEEKKAGVLYTTSTNLVKDVLANPTFGENIKRSQDLVATTVGFILKGQQAFHNLLAISSFDYYTYTHSVNVCTFSVALAQQMGFQDEQFLNELGTGALLHDVGKSKISDRILNKRSRLSSLEFEIMKKHPQWGADIAADSELITSSCVYPILQHHERGDRRGYPHALSLDEMHIYSRIVAIADSFDAMTTRRVYQEAMETFSALKIMFTVSDAYDEHALKAFVELMGPEGLKGI